MREPLTADDFRPHLGKLFRPAGHAGALHFVSLDTEVRPGWEAVPRQPFSLILRGPRASILPEGEYRFDIDGAEPFDLYIIPIHTTGREHQDYQIIFN
jgi:hypothetical protein